MSAFYLTLLAVLFAGLGARDQVKIAGLSLRQGQRPAVLLSGIAISIATAVFAAWAATLIAPLMAPAARVFLAALALAFAGVESLILVPRYRPAEPTQSLGALALVLLSHQLTDAARFLVFGIAVATNVPFPAGAGGVLGGIVLTCLAWAFPELVVHPRARLVRRLVGAVLLCLAVYVGLEAIGIF